MGCLQDGQPHEEGEEEEEGEGEEEEGVLGESLGLKKKSEGRQSFLPMGNR